MSQLIYYDIQLAVSIILLCIYMYRWKKHYDTNITIIYLIINLVTLYYTLLFRTDNTETAMSILKVIYLGGCYLPFFITMCVFNLCKIDLKSYVRFALFSISTLMFAGSLTMGHSELFYKSITVERSNGVIWFTKEYGPLHTVLYAVLALYFVVAIGVIVYTFFNKKNVSRTMLVLLIVPEIYSMLGYLANRVFGAGYEIMPLVYNAALVIYLFIVHRLSLYNIGEMAVERMVRSGDTGFISFDNNLNYLGSNETANRIFPELNNVAIDDSIKGVEEFKKTILHWLGHFREDESANKNMYVVKNPENPDEDKSYIVSIDYLMDGNRKRGYQILLTDDSQNQRYIRLLDQYNSELEEEVGQKTERIIEMHNNLIMSMATMVESRDNSTGGHIKRTSQAVRILIDEIRKDNKFDLTDEFCRDIIKAAPMHDLGKIAVDDAILRKPGRFTDEEFNEMKKHAAEGAHIVHEILKDTDDELFKVIAENVAHFHHERWDGSGYPEGLKGEEIPLEARIMAIADVYDALVSKRVYKESMSFEEADKIIMESMGKHFDEGLKEYYVKARPRLEVYYSTQNQ